MVPTIWTVPCGTREIELIAMPGGHTNGDVVVHFPDRNIVYLGDIIIPESFPVIWLDQYGDEVGVDRLIEILEQVIDRYDESTRFLSAHGRDYTMAGLKDIAKTICGGPPYCIAVVGKPGSLAAMATPDAVEGFARITPPNSSWRNEVCARIALTAGLYRPGVGASKIRCPILYCIGEQDIVTPARFAHQAAHRAPKSEMKTYDCGHFDLYVSPLWEKVVADQTKFLARYLL